MPRIRVAVLASFPAVHAGLVALLAAAGHDVLSGEDAAAEADVLVTDALRLVRDQVARAVLLTDVATPDVGASLPRDASAAMIYAAVRAVHAGLHVTYPALRHDAGADVSGGLTGDLTPREVEVLRLLAAGMTNRGAALALGISEHTVKFHVGSALAKLGARSRTEAVSIAARMGLLPL